ncbi:MAG: beta-ketoacyl-ACP synthase II, partial [Pseudomonadota bacterium]
MRRVVVTGLGMVSPLACGVQESWKRIIAGESGAGRISHFDPENLTTKIACEVPRKSESCPHGFDADEFVEKRQQRHMDPFIIYGIAAAIQAVEDSGWKPEDDEALCRTGVLIGSGIGGLGAIDNNAVTLYTKGPRRIGPFFIPSALINLISGQLSIKYGFKGPNHAVVTACATGSHAIGDAARLIMLDDADVMVAGGAEAAITPLGIAGFNACKALTTHFNDTPEKASRPYDKDRDGFLMGEGSGVVILEEYEHAKARGAKIYAEIIGYGLSGDAHHITSPAPDGNGGYRAMAAALKRAKISPEQIDYVNAHGTSTPMGDEIELRSVEKLFNGQDENLLMSSTKSSIGHLLGGAGAVEAVFSILAIQDNIAPPTLNLDNPSVETKIDLVPHKAKEKDINIVLSNSFGFGGTNASL